MALMDTRDIYRPFEYPEFEEIHRKLYTSFWHPDEVSLDEDIANFKHNLTEDERTVVSRILKNFVQSEIHIGCFWGDFVAGWFKKPEIQNVARYISGNESVHANGYDRLNESLGLAEYASLKEDKKLYARIETLINKKAKKPEDILKQLFLYSVMGEGVALFSSFLILFAFTKKNLMKGTGQIVSWSSLDESIHADVGAVLFNTMKKEYGLINDEMKEELYAIADHTVETEMNLIDRVFEGVTIDFISKEAVKNYVNNRANKQLKKVGLVKRYTVNKELLKDTEFFDIVVFGESTLDFFAAKETGYSRGLILFDKKVWE